MRRLLLLLCGIFAYQALNAESVSKSEALKKAQSFMPGKHFVESQSVASIRGEASSEAFYVFNADNNGGFVIVSGDDRTTEILGYSKTGNLDMDRLPDDLKWWLDGYARQMESLGTSVVPVQKTITRGVDNWDPVSPMIQTKWSQDYPYNKMCPDKNGLDWRDANFDTAHLMTGDQIDYHCVTGCVATAMAQVMYYFEHPDGCVAIPAYNTESKGWAMNSLPTTEFMWDKMKKVYNGNETDESADAVAKLFRYCGQAVEMDYRLYANGGSSASVSPYHMAHYFGFGKNAREVLRYNYSLTDWEHMIYEEVCNGRPVLYGGSSNSGGHMFIVDGYDGNGLFHMNWGWGGMSDGYYVLSLANPDDLGAGGGTNKDGYSWKQHAIIGLKQNDGEAEKPQFYAGFYNIMEQSEFSRGSAIEDFSDIEIPGYVFFQYNDPNINNTCTFKVGWGLYQNGNLQKVLGVSEYITSANNCVEDNWTSFSFGSGLADGKYQFRQVYQLQDSEEWQLCGTRDIVFVDAVISGNKLTLRKSSESVYTSNIEIQNVTYSPSELEEGKPVEVTITLTNNGDSFQELICFWVGSQRASLVCGSVESGKTGEVKLHITPNNSGNLTFKISTDAPKALSSANVVWTEQVSVSAPKPQLLSATATTPGLADKVLTGTTLRVNTLVTNEGSNKYENCIVLRLFKNTEDPSSHKIRGPLVATKTVMATIECGETKEVNFVVDDLDLDSEYFYDIYYLSGGSGVFFNLPEEVNTYFTLTDAAQTPVLGDLDDDNDVDEEDLAAIVGFIMAGEYNEKADLNNDSKVNAADIVEIVKIIKK